MIALDTNVLVRFLVQDDEEQSRRVIRFLSSAIKQGETFFISDIVLCETVWVLSVSYRLKRAEIAIVLQQLLHAKELVFLSPDRLACALDSFLKGTGDFADYVIREHARTQGCSHVVTFDRALLKEKDFKIP